MGQLSRRVAVTGGASGIGLAAVTLFAEAGARVAVIDRQGGEAAAELRRANLLPLVADVADEAQMEAAFGAVRAEFGGLDAVVVAAGVNGVWAPVTSLSVSEWDTVMNINLRGTFLTAKHAVPLLARGGAMVLVSSINGTRSFTNTGATPYAASKAAQLAMGKMLALELAGAGVRVNVVCPGATESAIERSTVRRGLDSVRFPVAFPAGDIPLTKGGKAKAREVAEAIVFLCSEGASHITGTELYIDGGQSLIL
ncbi:MAG TPA: SDR family NAD(P)-dependent oxidoreductase [Bryobacteraceae bacterium]|nr:SDR family NAD(P)-dependent oxidoreductase [Bryobacteraceae bacterium]